MAWYITAIANAIVALTYVGITAAIARPLMRDHEFNTNKLGRATALIFATCAVGHGLIAAKLLTDPAARLSVDGVGAFFDPLAAAVGLYYWSLRRTYPALLNGATLFADLKEKQRQALELNDGIVQGLAAAKLALELDQPQMTRDALESTLASARRLITDLLGQADGTAALEPGDMRRVNPAVLHSASS